MMFISNYERQYISILHKIYKDGFSDGVNARTGVATKRLPMQTIRVDLEEEFPILKSKKVYWRSALEEILWIMQKQSNNIGDLRPHIWDEWADPDGSIGKSYGYQVAQPVVTKQLIAGKIREVTYTNQVAYVLDTLKIDPSDRRCIITLWNKDELSEMNLNPCCHTSTWNLDGGRLNCLLDQRSGDFPVGVPFNTTQYAFLTILFARHLGVHPGILLHVIADAHIYDRQMSGVATQLEQYNSLLLDSGSPESTSIPKLSIDSNETDFFKFNPDTMNLSYYFPMSKVDFGDIVV